MNYELCVPHQLKDSATKHNVAIHAFVLMTNHVHLLMTAFSQIDVSRH
ncbi:transposase [Paraglaciecola sp. MB-3u-78]